jgi:hypothetical protein
MKSDALAGAKKRLLGTWRSDRELTVQNWAFPKRIAQKKLKFFYSIFGKNTWHFTPQFCFGEFEGEKWRARYEILWASEWSVVVLFHTKGGESCHHLFFEDEHFYLSAGRAGNVEYFKRIGA